MTRDAGPARQERELETLLGSIARSPIATVVTNPRLPDNPIVEANAAFSALTGYARDEILGRNCRFLAGTKTDPAARENLRDALREGRPILSELVNYRKDGSEFRNALMIAPVLDDAGKPLFFVGSQMDVGVAAAGVDMRQARALQLVGTLSPRQRQVLDGIVRGLRNKQIAATLGIEEATVKMHRSALLGRLGVSTSADAIRIGVEAGFGA